MSDLRFDTDAFDTAAREYSNLADNMEKLKKELAEAIERLVETEWVSPASRAFMEQYKGTWAENVMEYINFLRYLEEMLYHVRDEYGQLEQLIGELSFPET